MANRQSRRKEKNYNNNHKNIVSTNAMDESMSNLIKVGGVVIVVFVAFYVLTLSLTGNKENSTPSTNNDTKTPVSIQYNEIIAGETFKMNPSEYYVLFYDFSDKSSNTLYNGIMSSFKTNHEGAKIYTVDLSKGFSTPYISETSNPSAQQSVDLKVKGPTVIKISNGTNVAYAEGKDAIMDILK